MKRCPQCSTEYNDSINFCTKDGRSLITKTESRTRLCPHCANSIAEDALKCPYCKAEVADAGQKAKAEEGRSQSFEVPEWPEPDRVVSLEGEWPEREEDSFEARLGQRKSRTSAVSKVVLAAGVALCALGLFLLGETFIGRKQGSESQSMLKIKMKELEEAKLKELQEKDQKIQSLEAQLAQVRQRASESPNQLGALNAKLEKNQKELSTSQQRLNVVTRELDENSRQRAALKAKLDETQRDLATSQQRLNIAIRELNRAEASRSQPSRVSTQAPVEPAPPAPARRPAEPGTYETIRTTTVHENPSVSSRVIAQLGRGTKLTVVKAVGSWLEVRSRHGKPPGYIRLDDAVYVSSAN
ncbi:MAG: SH3 domain-containing protein [Candidatus Binatia bacterium]